MIAQLNDGHTPDAPSRAADWLAANQACLVAEFRRIAAVLAESSGAAGNDGLNRAEAAASAARADMPAPPAIDVIEAAFGLTPFERDLLLLVAGVEIDAELAARWAESTDQFGDGPVTARQALQRLRDGHWSAVTDAAPLRRMRLIEVGSGPMLATSPLRVDERILQFIGGVNLLDERLRPLLRERSAGPIVTDRHRALARTVASHLRSARGLIRPIVQLYGDDPDGQLDVAALASAELDFNLWTLPATDLPQSAAERFGFATLWARETALLGATLLIDLHAADAGSGADELLNLLPDPIFVATRDPLATRCESVCLAVDRPDERERRLLWKTSLGPAADQLGPALDLIANQYRMSSRAIAAAGLVARAAADDGHDPNAAARRACIARGRPALDDLARRLNPRAGWDDLVLPAATADSLHQIVMQVRNRGVVQEAWGFGERDPRGLGITALFAGESGTGKTLAAGVIAADLGFELFQIDLSIVVSKYIGETEKNLRHIFDAAEECGAILLFDEADALFGKRSEVRDSHDRFANIEVSYLLQRMETYAGLAILTSNMKSTLDRSFLRRLRFNVQFPFPDAAQRERIWRRAFPGATPLNQIDYVKLAKIAVAGGGIRNIAINAAFLAAAEDAPVKMAHVIAATRAEFAKGDRTLAEAETRGWA